ncbi:oligopeptide transporter OPT superfamily protein, partial [Tanacetum coccineum]
VLLRRFPVSSKRKEFQKEVLLRRFENAVTSIDKSGHIDPKNVAVAVLLQNIRVYTKCNTKKVLTMERLYGVPLTDLDMVADHQIIMDQKSLKQRADAMGRVSQFGGYKHIKDIAEECKKVLDAVGNICPQRNPNAFVDIRLQETVSRIFELLPQLWAEADQYEETCGKPIEEIEWSHMYVMPLKGSFRNMNGDTVMMNVKANGENGEIERDKREEMEQEKKDDGDHVDGSKRLQPWTKQITLRGVVASFIIGSIYSIIAMKLNLTTGMTPNMNVSAALLAFVFMRSWTKMLQKSGISSVQRCQQKVPGISSFPFTKAKRERNEMDSEFRHVQLPVTALPLEKTYELAGGASSPGTYKEPGVGWMMGYSFLVCFIGLFVLIPLRKVLIVDYKLVFPSGMATAVLINGFHSQGDDMAKKQVKGFTKYFSASFLWGFFQWFFTGKEGECGFVQFPTFGLQAWKNTFYFDFSMTYVGTGMICPHIVNISLMFGAVVSWGIMWPLIGRNKGVWYPNGLPESSMKSLNGYKAFISIALILGDGLYNFVKILYITSISVHGRFKTKNLNPASGTLAIEKKVSEDEQRQNEVFIRESIPMSIGGIGYIVFAIIAVIAIPMMFPEVKWYYVILAYIFAPSLAFCNAYGAGLTDINMAYNYGKIGLFMMAALAGKEQGVVAGMVGCGLVKSVVSVSCILMHDLKTGQLTLTSPRTMLLSQAIGTAIGCIVSPLSFFLFYKAFDIGNPDGEYKAPYALIYRSLAILGVQGFSALPKHCLHLCYGFFAFAVLINMIKDMLPKKIGKWMPLPICMAVPFLVGGYFAIDMCIGSLVVFVWQKVNAKEAESMVPAVASGLICGEGMWSLPASVLALAKISPPICMKFLSS